MDIRCILVQARGLVEAGRYPEAIRALQRAAHQRPDFPDVHNQLGLALSLAGEALRAESHLQRAIELNPDYAEAHLNVAILLFERGAYHAAREHMRAFDRIVRRSGDGFPDAALDDLAKRHAALAERYRAYGLLEEAEQQMRQALRLRPGYCDMRLRLSRVLFERSKLDESAAQIDILLQQRPQYDEAHLLRGRIEAERGRLAAARDAWLRVRRGAAAVQARALLDKLANSRGMARLQPPVDGRRVAGGGP